MTLGYLSSVTYSVFICLTLSSALTSSFVSHSLSTPSWYFPLFHPHSLLSPSLLCHSVFYTIQVPAVEGDKALHAHTSMRKKTDILTNGAHGQSLYFCLLAQSAGNVTQSSDWAWLLSLDWILLHIICYCLLHALDFFISQCCISPGGIQS